MKNSMACTWTFQWFHMHYIMETGNKTEKLTQKVPIEEFLVYKGW